MTTRVLLLTQWFDPEPTSKGMAFARELTRLDCEVEVVTGFPNYPGGKLYPGYRMKWLQRERIDGIQITRVPLYPSHDGSSVRRALNYLSFAAAALTYCLFGAKKPHVIYAYLPPLTVGIGAALVGIARRVPVVCNIHDMWPDTLQATGMVSNAHVIQVMSRMCNWVYRHVDRIVVVTPGFKRLLLDRGVPECRVDVIYNWCDQAALLASVRGDSANLPGEGKFRIAFAGNIGKAQGMDAVIQAAVVLQVQAPGIHFIFIGGGVEVSRLKQLVGNLGLMNVSFLPRVPENEIGWMLRKSDALLVHLRKDRLFEITIPSKTQAYMAIGKPVLMAVNGEAAALVRDSACGVLAVPDDADSIASAALALFRSDGESLGRMGECGRHYYDEHLSLRAGTARFAKIFHQLAGDQSVSASC
jgi:colanic acid biosynthesis glycosyl transferase WcaI